MPTHFVWKVSALKVPTSPWDTPYTACLAVLSRLLHDGKPMEQLRVSACEPRRRGDDPLGSLEFGLAGMVDQPDMQNQWSAEDSEWYAIESAVREWKGKDIGGQKAQTGDRGLAGGEKFLVKR